MMRPNPILSLLCLLPGLLLGLPSAPASAQIADENVVLVEKGTHRLFREGERVERVAIGDASIADVRILNRREMLITGKDLGVTSLLVWQDRNAPPREYRVRVSAVRDPMRSAQPDPDLASAVVDPGTSLEGRLPNLLAHRRAKIAAQAGASGPVADTSQITLETQVLTEVKIAEVRRSTLQQFGLNALKSSASTIAGISTPGTFAGNAVQAPLQNAYNVVVGDPSRGILGILSLLEQKGLARTLAEPTLLATSGQTATYLVGGEFPVPVSQGGRSGGGITVEYKEFGVRLGISPTILSRDRIALKVAPEVSDLDFSAGIQIGGVAVPALAVRRTDTTVELGDGESFVISGLVSSQSNDAVNKVPWLGDIPVLGAFFRSAVRSKEERELIMVVTPYLVKPLAREARLPPVPGQRLDERDPNMAETIFLESGNFNTGFGR
jgi:pilus assembly protein CpaC